MTTSSFSLTSLHEEFARRGWNHKPAKRTLLAMSISAMVALGGIAVFIFTDHIWIRVCAILASTAGSLAIGTNAHTASHYAVSNHKWVNELLFYIGFPLTFGLSATHWWQTHVVGHHPHPNVIGIDQDADFGPMFALTRDAVEATTGLKRFYYEKLQWWIFPLVLSANGFNMQRAGWVHLVQMLRSPRRKWTHWADLGTIVLHFLVWIVIPCIWFPFSDVAAFYALRLALLGYALYAVVGIGHLPAEAVRLRAGKDLPSHLVLQTATTINFRAGFWGRHLCCGLEYQIEHHLFPYINHIYYPEISKILKKFCEDHKLPYRSYSWPVAIWKSWAVMKNPPAIQSSL